MNQSKIDPKPYNWRLGNLCDCFANRIWHCTYTILPPSLSHDYPNHCLYPMVDHSGYGRACVRACPPVAHHRESSTDQRYLPNMEACGSQLCVRERRRVHVLYLYVYIITHSKSVHVMRLSLTLCPD